MKSTMTPQEIRRALLLRQELAIVDLREEAIFALAHPLFAAQIPLASLAAEMPLRVPRLATQIVVYDEGEGLVEPALELLRQMGYSNVSYLDGGLARYGIRGLPGRQFL